MIMFFKNGPYYDPYRDYLVQSIEIQTDKIKKRIKETSTDTLKRYVKYVDSISREMNPIKKLCYFFGLDSYRYLEAREELRKRNS